MKKVEAGKNKEEEQEEEEEESCKVRQR